MRLGIRSRLPVQDAAMFRAQPRRNSEKSVRRLAPMVAIAILLGGGACGADSATKPEDLVTGVTMTSTRNNPHVGEETILGVIPVGAGGGIIHNVDCMLTADHPEFLTLT